MSALLRSGHQLQTGKPLSIVIHFWAYRDDRVSFTRVAEAIAEHLSFDIEVALIDWDEKTIFARWYEGVRSPCWEPAPRNPAVSIGFGDIHRLHWLKGDLRIGNAAWETTRIAFAARRRLRRLDELWVPTTWVGEVLTDLGLGAMGLHVVPHGVDCAQFAPRADAGEGSGTAYSPAGEGTRPLRFLSVGKWEKRKGFDVLVRAFVEVFGDAGDAELVLHCGCAPNDPRVLGDIRSWVGSVPSNVIVSPPVDADALPGVYQSADAFVLATRGEGWGLPVSEAMACGLPSIVTRCTGLLDYHNASMGYPLRVAGRHFVRDGAYPMLWRVLPRYGRWFEPDPDHLCELLRLVADEPAERRRRGAAARHAMATRWTWAAAAAKAKARLAALGVPGLQPHTGSALGEEYAA